MNTGILINNAPWMIPFHADMDGDPGIPEIPKKMPISNMDIHLFRGDARKRPPPPNRRIIPQAVDDCGCPCSMHANPNTAMEITQNGLPCSSLEALYHFKAAYNMYRTMKANSRATSQAGKSYSPFNLPRKRQRAGWCDKVITFPALRLIGDSWDIRGRRGKTPSLRITARVMAGKKAGGNSLNVGISPSAPARIKTPANISVPNTLHVKEARLEASIFLSERIEKN